MNYKELFDKKIVRRGSNCVKWDETDIEDIIPLWVADMDFEAAPAIKEALRKRVEHGVFGYAMVPESYYQAVINWFSRRHQWEIKREWIIYTTGVVPAISAAVKGLCTPGDKVIIQTPVYNCFFSSIKNNDCEILENPLRRVGNTYEIDFEDLEAKAADPKAKVLLFCNPHNPGGKVWTREELKHVNDICMRHGVMVISDEIHCELVMPGHTYTPFAAVSEECLNNSVVFNSSSKSFNIAGLHIANIVTKNDEWRKKINRAINIFEICDVNPFGIDGLKAAYNESEEWIDELNKYLYSNYQALCEFFARELPQLPVFNLEGTYLVWVDITATGLSSDALTDKLLKEGHVWVNPGTMYGAPADQAYGRVNTDGRKNTGEGFIRINIACPKAQLMEGLERIKKVLG